MESFGARVTIWVFLLQTGLAMDNGDIISFQLMDEGRDGQFGRPSKFAHNYHQRLEKKHRRSYNLHPSREENGRNTLNLHNIDDKTTGFLQSDYGHFQPENHILDIVDQKGFDRDKNGYVYPASPVDFHTKISLQRPETVPDAENYGSFHMPPDFGIEQNRRPEFWTKAQNRPLRGGESSLEKLSAGSQYYIQKLVPAKRWFSSTDPSHHLDDTNSNRYEEVELTHGHPGTKVAPKNSQKQMTVMMKKYLTRLLVGQYGRRPIKGRVERSNKTSGQAAMNDNRLSSSKISKVDQESKFLYADTLSMLKNKTLSKIKQLFSIFTVVNFNNAECNTTNWAGSWQGTCLTSSECSQASGTALGSCAQGFGVCCVFRGSCGDSSNANCSYFKSPNYPDYYPADGGVVTPTTTPVPGVPITPDPRLHWYYQPIPEDRQSSSDTTSCVFMVNKANANVRQMRIDFVDLDLAGPTNGTCTDERLIITGQNSNDQIPVICGYNTGQHVYVDVSQLSGPITVMVLSATGARKRFKMKICQYTDTCQTSQSNCLQYFTGTSGVIQSFNYDRAAMFSRGTPGYFNNLNYAVCIRREAGYCSITYTNMRNSRVYPFQLVNSLPNGQITVPTGQAGVDVLNCPDDFVIIDGTRLCGDRFNDGSTVMNFSQNAPVVDTDH